MSPPPQDRGPIQGLYTTMYCDAHGYQHQRPQQNMDSITKHFQGMELAGTNSLSGYSDCVICGKSVEQIKDEAVIDYMHKTAATATSIQSTQADKTPYLAHCHCNETFDLKVIILELLVMVFILFVIHVKVVEILCA